jgi:hypothetical protein
MDDMETISGDRLPDSVKGQGVDRLIIDHRSGEVRVHMEDGALMTRFIPEPRTLQTVSDFIEGLTVT